jgi:hypothetical protein
MRFGSDGGIGRQCHYPSRTSGARSSPGRPAIRTGAPLSRLFRSDRLTAMPPSCLVFRGTPKNQQTSSGWGNPCQALFGYDNRHYRNLFAKGFVRRHAVIPFPWEPFYLTLRTEVLGAPPGFLTYRKNKNPFQPWRTLYRGVGGAKFPDAAAALTATHHVAWVREMKFSRLPPAQAS